MSVGLAQLDQRDKEMLLAQDKDIGLLLRTQRWGKGNWLLSERPRAGGAFLWWEMNQDMSGANSDHFSYAAFPSKINV